MPTILDKIVASKHREIERSKLERPLEQLRSLAADAPAPRDFLQAVSQQGGIRLIAEVKKASPSQGLIRADFDPVAIARAYETAGAAAISVLTDGPFFQGSLEYLASIRQVVSSPLLRKDFILDRHQIWEARAAGADAVLLIAECLDNCHLRMLHDAALELEMTPLVEFYEPENLERVVDAGALLIGVNNRDLRTFQVDLQHVVRMRRQIPADRIVVAESGIASRQDAIMLQEQGIQAMLVGEHLMRQPNLEVAVKELIGS